MTIAQSTRYEGNLRKNLSYAYPSSQNATAHGYKSGGCWIISKLAGNECMQETAFKNEKTAKIAFSNLSLPIDRWSM
jgi:hypothetical protein